MARIVMYGNETSKGPSSILLSYIPLALVLSVAVFVRIRLLTVPLERDEGEFAYIGQLLLKGIPPFIHAYTMKLPGASAMYALFMFLFGQTPAGIHIGLLIVNGMCIFLVFLLTKRLFDRETALISCASYAVLSLSQSVYGAFAHATHFVVMFSLAGFVLLLRYLENNNRCLLLISGFCFGLAFTMKQHAIFLAIFAFLYLVWRGRKNSRTGENQFIASFSYFLPGAFAPYAVLVVGLIIGGVFDNFWFWTVRYAHEYVSEQTIAQGFINFSHSFGPIIMLQWPFLLLAGAGCVFLFIKQRSCTDRLFVLGFLFFSFLSICPGLQFREHYFVMLLPALAILAGSAIRTATLLFSSSSLKKYRHFFPALLLLTAVLYGLYHEKEYFFTLPPQEVSRATYGENPFPEAIQVARYIKERTSPNDRIAVLGSEPEIYFYADRLSATGHIYMYGLMENQPHAAQMQHQLIREIETARPKYIVVVNVAMSWLIGTYSKGSVLEWGENYVWKQYDLAGVIDIVDSSTTRYFWDDKAVGCTPVSHAFLTVFKRKVGA